jgi:hypothetical protein
MQRKYYYIPEINDPLKELLAAISDDPGAVSSEICALPGCGKPYKDPWYLEFYRPDLEPNFSTRCLSACSSDHHQQIIDHFGLAPFMNWGYWNKGRR